MSDETHPHDLLAAAVPVRLPAAELRELSRIDPARAVGAIAAEWTAILATIALATWIDHPVATLLAIPVIGARQHALLILAHDASHFRLLPDRRTNDLVGNLFLSWPMFASVQGFRHFHAPHHRHLQGEGDGNRELWGTHDADGQLAAEWRYPKSRSDLAWTLLRRVGGGTGLWWILRGVVGGFAYGMTPFDRLLRATFMLAVAAVLTATSSWTTFALYWVLPYCSWHLLIQYVRLICEHSNVQAEPGVWSLTRTTVPTAWEALFVLPRGIGYHIEHHWYPSVPFYRLGELHARLMQEPAFRSQANISTSVLGSLAEVTATPSGS
jgi:fatty acid desaturase